MLKLSLGWKPIAIEFEGEQITLEIKPLSSIAFLEIMPLLNLYQKNIEGKTSEQIEMEMSVEDSTTLMQKFQEKAKLIFNDHIKDGKINGVEIDGNPLTIDVLTNEFVLAPLSFLIMTEMIALTNIDKINLGKLPGLPSEGQQGS